jgi:hypothetical protein
VAATVVVVMASVVAAAADTVEADTVEADTVAVGTAMAADTVAVGTVAVGTAMAAVGVGAVGVGATPTAVLTIRSTTAATVTDGIVRPKIHWGFPGRVRGGLIKLRPRLPKTPPNPWPLPPAPFER